MKTATSLLIIGALLPALARAATTCDADQASCEACAASSDSNSLDLIRSYIPRITAGGPGAPKDLADYNWFDCSDTSDSGRCSFNVDPANVQTEAQSSELTPAVYIATVALFVALGGACCFLGPFLAFTLCCFRCQCCCCCCKYGCCGRGAPTEAHTGCSKCFGCGFKRLKARKKKQKKQQGGDQAAAAATDGGVPLGPDGVPDVAPEDFPVHYSCFSRWCTRFVMYLSFAGVAGSVYVAYANGAMKLGAGLEQAAEAPTGTLTVARSLRQPMAQVLQATGGHLLAPFLIAFNETLSAKANVPLLVDSIVCVVDSVDGLPSADTLLTSIDGFTYFGNNLTTAMTGMSLAVGNLSEATVSTKASVVNLRLTLGNMTQAIDESGVNAALEVVKSDMNALQDESTGLTNTSSNLAAFLSTAPTSVEASQLQATCTSVADGSAGHAGTSDDSAADAVVTSLRGSLSGNASELRTAVAWAAAARPALATLDAALTTLDTSGSLDAAVTAAQDFQAQVGAWPTSTEILDALADLEAAVGDVDVAPLVEALSSADEALSNLPDFSIVTTELQKLDAVNDILVCMNSTIQAMDSIQTHLIQLPDMVDTVRELRDSAQSAVGDLNDKIGDFLNTTGDIEANLANVPANLTGEYGGALADLSAQLANPLNFTGLRSSVTQFGASVGAAGLDQLVTTLTALQTVVSAGGYSPSTQLVAWLQDVETNGASHADDWDAADAELASWATEYRCNDDAAPEFGDSCLPSDGSACNSNPSVCVRYVAACVASAGGDPGDASRVRCDSTSACSTTTDTVCSLDYSSLQTAATDAAGLSTLAAAAEGASPSPSATVALYTSTGASVDATSLMAVQQVKNTALRTAGENIDVSGATSDLSDLETDLDDVQSDLSDMSSDIDDALDAANQISGSGSPLVTAREAVVGMADQLDTIEEQKSQLNDVKLLLTTIKSYFFQQMGADIEQYITSEALAAAYQADGLAGLLLNLARFADSAVAALAQGGDSLTFDFSAEEQLADVDALVLSRMLDDDEAFAAGPAQYTAKLLQQLGVISNNTVVTDAEGSAEGATIFNDPDGEPWSDDRLCLTRLCISASAAQIQSEPVSGPVEMPVDLGLPLPMLLLLPFAFPVLIAVLNLMPAICCCIGRQCHATWACTMQFFTCVFLPLMILFSIGIYLPLAMVFADSCSTGANLVAPFATGSAQFICTDLLGGAGTVYDGVPDYTECVVSSGDISTTVPVTELALAVVGTSGSCPASRTAAVDAMWSGLAAALPGMVNETVEDSVIGAIAPGEPFSIQPSLADLLRAAGHNASEVAVAAVGGLGHVLDCEAMGQPFSSMHDGMCCQMGSVLGWLVIGWVGVTLSICCLGYPALFFGFKRWPNELWGEFFLAAADPERIAAEEARKKRREDARKAREALRHKETATLHGTDDGTLELDDGGAVAMEQPADAYMGAGADPSQAYYVDDGGHVGGQPGPML